MAVLPLICQAVLSDKPTNTLLKQLSIKLIQRIGLVSLKPRIVSWRYQKARHNLMSTETKDKEKDQEYNADDDDDILDDTMIEEVIERLLNALKEKV